MEARSPKLIVRRKIVSNRTLSQNVKPQLDYPIYFFPGGANEEVFYWKSLSDLETIDIEVSSSDDDVSLSEYEVIQIDDTDQKCTVFPKIDRKPPIKLAQRVKPKDCKPATNMAQRAKPNDFNPSTKLAQKGKPSDLIKALKCEVCSRFCSSFTLLQEHFRRAHPQEEFHVLCCDLQFTEQLRLEEHMSIYHSDADLKEAPKRRPFTVQTEEVDAFIQHYIPNLECTVCGEERLSFEDLKEHFRQHHPLEECHILCGRRKLTGLYAIAEHIRVHLDANTFKCELCGEFHLTKMGLQQHMCVKHKKPMNVSQRQSSFKVTNCNNKAISRTRYTDLDNFISEWRQSLECVVCSEPCSNFTSLELHFGTKHPNEEFYVSCCAQKIKTRHQLEEHIYLHTDPMSFKCPVCSICFTKRSTLYEHMCTEHPFPDSCCNDADSESETTTMPVNNVWALKKIDELIAQWNSVAKCGECNMEFTTFTTLKAHFYQKHPHKQCYLSCCQLKLTYPTCIIRHLRLHIYQGGHPQASKRIRRKTFDDIIAQWKPNLECGICQKSCLNFTLLKHHFHCQHPDEKCYIECCRTKLTTRYQIEQHIGHKDTKGYLKCQFCKKYLSSQKTLFYHTRYHHPEINPGLLRVGKVNTSEGTIRLSMK